MIKRIAGALVTGAVSACLITGTASAAPDNYVHRVASCRARGDFAICVAGGNVNRPLALYVYVSATPGQHVSGAWTVVCSKGLGAGSKSGSFSGRTTLRRYIRMPYRRPDSCTVSADAQLSHSGRLHVWIDAVKR